LNKKIQPFLFYGILIAVIAIVAFSFSQAIKPDKTTYTDFAEMIKNEQIAEFSLSMENGKLEYKLKSGVKGNFNVPNLDLFIFDFGEQIKAQRDAGTLKYDILPAQSFPIWAQFIPYVILAILFILGWRFMMNQMSGGGKNGAMSFGRAKTKLASDSKKVTFAEVAGADEEKEELAEIVEFLKTPKKFLEMGARIPKGVLLVGPPGTGKTLLARAVAGEAGVPFFLISGSDFVEMYVGVGASRVRDLFDQAKKCSPCIVFIDEIDAVGRYRGAGLGGGHDEREQTLNQLLVEMDGFAINEGIIVMAATNRADILDPALLRPGRFDRQIYVNIPDVKGREEIMKVHAKGKPIAEEVDFSVVAKMTVGFTGADIENLLNEAAILAVKRGKKIIENVDIEDSVTKVMMGPEKKSRVVTDRERRLVAYHEAGHAITSKFLKTADPVHEITTIPRGMAGGYTLSIPKEDTSFHTKIEMSEKIVTFLGGRVAEKLVLDDISTGASNDIEVATHIARNMVTKYGMSDRLGPILFGGDQEQVFLGRELGHARNYSESIAAAIDEEIKRIIDEAYNTATTILRDNIDILHRVAQYLLENEKMTGEQFESMFNEEPVSDAE